MIREENGKIVLSLTQQREIFEARQGGEFPVKRAFSVARRLFEFSSNFDFIANLLRLKTKLKIISPRQDIFKMTTN